MARKCYSTKVNAEPTLSVHRCRLPGGHGGWHGCATCAARWSGRWGFRYEQQELKLQQDAPALRIRFAIDHAIDKAVALIAEALCAS